MLYYCAAAYVGFGAFIYGLSRGAHGEPLEIVPCFIVTFFWPISVLSGLGDIVGRKFFSE